MKPRRYQTGTIEEIKTKQGPCWYIRFTTPDGKRPRYRIGLKSQYATKAKASLAANYMRVEFNEELPTLTVRSFGDVIAKYENEELPKRHSTRRGYLQIDRLYLLPRWGEVPLLQMKPAAVRSWILQLDLNSRTKGHIHDHLRLLFRFAMLWEWYPRDINPMGLFSIPGAKKRFRKPKIITPEQFRTILDAQSDLTFRAMLIGGYCLGLRVSELFALKWKDFDESKGRVLIQRAIVEGRIGSVKTERSEAELPLVGVVKENFAALRKNTQFDGDEDWVFASKFHGGSLPLNPGQIQQQTLRLAGEAMKLDFNLGWQTLRHSYKVLLELASVDISTQRDLMRHSDVHTTLHILWSGSARSYAGKLMTERSP
jgi:integrase